MRYDMSHMNMHVASLCILMDMLSIICKVYDKFTYNQLNCFTDTVPDVILNNMG